MSQLKGPSSTLLGASLAGFSLWASAFRYHGFRFLWVSLLFNSFAMWMEQLALGWLILEMTDSPFMVGVAAAVRLAPFLLIGILAGAVADRVDRHLFLRFLTAAAGLVTVVMAVLVISNTIQVWHALLLSLASGVFRAFTATVRPSYVYDLVGPNEALNGMALASLSQRLGGVIGSLAAGFLIATVDVGGAYLAMSASYVLATVILFAITEVGQAAPTERHSVVENIRSSFRAMRGNRTLVYLMALTASVEMLGFSHQTLLPVIARDVLGVGAGGLGIMMAVRSAGGVLGVLFLAVLGNYRRKGWLSLISMTLFGIGIIALSQSGIFIVMLIMLTLTNFAAGINGVLAQTLMQANVPNEERGRAMGSWAASIGLAPLGHMELGAVAGTLGTPVALLINGAALAIIGVASAIGLPRIRRLE